MNNYHFTLIIISLIFKQQTFAIDCGAKKDLQEKIYFTPQVPLTDNISNSFQIDIESLLRFDFTNDIGLLGSPAIKARFVIQPSQEIFYMDYTPFSEHSHFSVSLDSENRMFCENENQLPEPIENKFETKCFVAVKKYSNNKLLDQYQLMSAINRVSPFGAYVTRDNNYFSYFINTNGQEDWTLAYFEIKELKINMKAYFRAQSLWYGFQFGFIQKDPNDLSQSTVYSLSCLN